MKHIIKPISFWELISQYSIEIPIIQRDYVQGRSDAETSKKREKFLEALHNALIYDDKYQTLDFVYGEECNNKLQPLDGQQRLTTLFLLHWYISTKETTTENNLKEIVKPILNKFTYETRTSSREFCECLVMQGCSIIDNEVVSTTIKTKTNWWVLSWDQDPTIKAMLNMLDSIQAKFTEPMLWDKLIDKKITFVNIPISDFGLSDDLYVKMNARGKALTNFENWKAEFEKHVLQNKWEEGKSIIDLFSHKIDTSWTDLFWKYRDSDNKIDAKIWSFIRAMQLTHVAISRDIGSYNKENLPYYDVIQYTKEDYQYLYRSLSLMAQYDNSEESNYALEWFNGDTANESLFSIIADGAYEYVDLILFFGELIALEAGISLGSEIGLDWMRVIRNVCYNSTIDSLSTFKGALLLVDEISAGCSSIYKWLSANTIKSNFAAEQIREERFKATLICNNSEWKKEIFRCEDSAFCEGKITFALKCTECNSIDTFNMELFRSVTDVIYKYFALISNQSIKHKLWRAFLTVGDNKFYTCWSSWSYQTECRKRWIPNTIKELRDYCNNKYIGVSESGNYAIQLVEILRNIDLDDYIKDYICDPNIPSWKQKLITGKESFKYCTSGYLCVSDDEQLCWLIDGVRPSNTDRYRKII